MEACRKYTCTSMQGHAPLHDVGAHVRMCTSRPQPEQGDADAGAEVMQAVPGVTKHVQARAVVRVQAHRGCQRCGACWNSPCKHS